MMETLLEFGLTMLTKIARRLSATRRLFGNQLADDRGDVPGWVLVTVMTAGLVTGLWVVADEQLGSLLSRAITSVSK